MTRTLYDLDIPYVLECNLMALMSEHFQNHLTVLDDASAGVRPISAPLSDFAA